MGTVVVLVVVGVGDMEVRGAGLMVGEEGTLTALILAKAEGSKSVRGVWGAGRMVSGAGSMSASGALSSCPPASVDVLVLDGLMDPAGEEVTVLAGEKSSLFTDPGLSDELLSTNAGFQVGSVTETTIGLAFASTSKHTNETVNKTAKHCIINYTKVNITELQEMK